MLRLYDYLSSGNAFKVRLLLTQLGLPFQRIELDIIKGETRTPEFLRKFPNGRIPAVEFDDGRMLFESGAIISYFAEGTRFMPQDRFERAQALQWLFFEQYSHEPYIAVVRFLAMHPDVYDERRQLLERTRRLGYDALAIMEGHLADARMVRRLRLFSGGYRPVRVHARRRRGRIRSRRIPRDSRMARAREGATRLHPDHASGLTRACGKGVLIDRAAKE